MKSLYRGTSIFTAIAVMAIVIFGSPLWANTKLPELTKAINTVLIAKPLPDDCSPGAAAWLMHEVAFVESGVTVNGEIQFLDGKGPDYGPFQINIDSTIDILSRCKTAEITEITGYIHDPKHVDKDVLIYQLKHNTELGVYIFREKFGHQSFRDPDGSRSVVWTSAATVTARAVWWKTYYNTELGAGTVERYLGAAKMFREVLNATRNTGTGS